MMDSMMMLMSRGSKLDSNMNGHRSTTPRSSIAMSDTIYQIDKVSESNSANSFPRQINGGPNKKCGESPTKDERNNGNTDSPILFGEDDEDAPFIPKRSSSLFTPGGAATLTLRHSKSQRECNTTSSTLVNPKRISIATSSFWLDHPDMEKFAKTLDFGPETMKTQSVWGASDQESDGAGAGCVDIWGDPPAVKKGVLMQQREKLWSRWKERYVILTRDYLNCFRKTANVHRSGVTLSEMGSFIFKLRVADVEEIRWENRRSGSVIALVMPQEPRILLRVPSDNTEALHQWYTLLQECIYMSKERRQALRSHHSSTYGKTCSLSKPKSRLQDLKDDLRQMAENQSRSNTNSRNKTPSLNRPDDDDDEDYDDVEGDGDDHRSRSNCNSNSSMNGDGDGGVTCDSVDFVPIYSKRSSRASLLKSGSGSDLTDFIRNWETPKPEENENKQEEGQNDDEEAENAQENRGTTSHRNSNSRSSHNRKLSNGYAIPADSLLRLPHNRNKRPESWNNGTGTTTSNHHHPQSNLFYRTPSIVPSQWMGVGGKKEFPLVRAAGAPFGGRSTMIVCPSRITAEVTYIRRM